LIVKKEDHDVIDCVYRVSCANCDKTYIGETGRKLGIRIRLQEHRMEVDSKAKRAFTGSQPTTSLSEHN